MSEYVEQDWFNTEIFCYLQQELFCSVWDWPEGVCVEERETKSCDIYQKWSESHMVIKVDDRIAAEMNMGGKHGDTIKSFTIVDRKLLAEIFKRMINT